MSQVTLYLDAETEAKLKAAAKASGISVSKWVARLIQERTAERWPDSVRALVGAWSDVEPGKLSGKDIRRERL